MNANKYIKRQALIYSAMLLIGLVALFVGYILKFETHAMSGVAIGCIPTGLACLLITLYARNKPAMYRNIESEADERSIFIRNKTGATAFWLTFLYIGALTIFSNIITLSLNHVGTYTLIFMSVIYFFMFFINIKKY
ncbi:MAG: hypothetical protein CVU90_06390 [Firmicutes bacterium HGW-Firmicutes-15]|nr:MAG: hypothetical protein CVU90_06390 [Firmicutes bacterium HGW-Firmicutes-15]